MTTTAADRAKAHALWNELLCNGGVPGWNALDVIAAALAAERAAAVADLRARVEAVAEELEADSGRLAAVREWRTVSGHQFADGIREGQMTAAVRLRAAVTDTTGDPA